MLYGNESAKIRKNKHTILENSSFIHCHIISVIIGMEQLYYFCVITVKYPPIL